MSPGSQAKMLVSRIAPESPAGRHHRPGVVGDRKLADLIRGAQAPVGTAGILSRLGGVLGQITRHPDVGAFAFGIAPDRPYVELGAPANHQGCAVWPLGPQR